MPYYASVQDVKDFSKLTYSDFGYAGEDAFAELVQKALEMAEGAIDSQLRLPRGFFRAGGYAVTEYADWSTPYVFSSYRPILSLTSISYDSAGYGTSPSWVALVPDTDYIGYLDEGRFYVFTKTPGKTERSIKIVYTAGYSTVPQDIRLATAELAGAMLHAMLQRKIAPTVEVSDMSIRAPVSIQIPESVATLISPYRRH